MTTSAATKFHAFLEHLAEKVHNLGSDTLKVALVAAANAPNAASHAVLADLTEISYTYCSTRALTTTSSAQSGGTYKNVVNDLTITASGGSVGPYRYIVLYNDTPTSPADPLICYWDRGADVTLADGDSMPLDFDQVAGLISITG